MNANEFRIKIGETRNNFKILERKDNIYDSSGTLRTTWRVYCNMCKQENVMTNRSITRNTFCDHECRQRIKAMK